MRTGRSNRNTGFTYLLLILIGAAMCAHAQGNGDLEARKCGDCHACAVPSVRDTCLRVIAESEQSPFHHEIHNLTEAPDSCILSSLTETFAPVCFSHKSHAQMAEMGSGCPTCHHYSPAGEIPPCRQCHNGMPTETGRQLHSLQDAYHLQCRACHENWTSDTTCAPCHQSHGRTLGVVEPSESPELAESGGSPSAVLPVSKVYVTNLRDSFVTFQHMEHIELFQLQCTDCHQQQQCRNCHTGCKTAGTLGETHNARITCLCCHNMDRTATEDASCTKCHDVKPHPPIFHEIVGKTIPEYLGKITCRTCHDSPKQMNR